MAKFSLPKVNYKDIDLNQYGGEGTLRVEAMTIGTSNKLTCELQKKAEADGYSLADIEKHQVEIDRKYTWDMIFLTIHLCTKAYDDEGEPYPLELEDIENFPPDFASALYDEIMELNNFPLGQNAGEESKKEQSKPTEEA